MSWDKDGQWCVNVGLTNLANVSLRWGMLIAEEEDCGSRAGETQEVYISSSQTAQEEARCPQGMILLPTVNSWVYI